MHCETLLEMRKCDVTSMWLYSVNTTTNTWLVWDQGLIQGGERRGSFPPKLTNFPPQDFNMISKKSFTPLWPTHNVGTHFPSKEDKTGQLPLQNESRRLIPGDALLILFLHMYSQLLQLCTLLLAHRELDYKENYAGWQWLLLCWVWSCQYWISSECTISSLE
jgi:hypothetical protein